tara:strand:+ start:252 stop:920 length:669 start_codon:yes stop_codon:yes gene_type:complete
MKKKFDSKGLFEMILLVVFLFFASLELNDLNNIQDPEIKISDLPIASEVVSDDVADLEEVKETKTIADFKTEETSLLWNIVNDGVMGGISRGEAYVTNESCLFFTGSISLENNGGFSSIRSFGQGFDLSDWSGIELRVKGDGRKYYFTSRSGRFDFWHPMETKKDEWITVRIPFRSFYATTFGRRIPGIRLNSKSISSFGIMLFDKKDGPFTIELDYIKAYN